MKKILLLGLFLSAWVQVPITKAENYFKDGNGLISDCRLVIRSDQETLPSRETIVASSCLGYVEGILDMAGLTKDWRWVPKERTVCLPAGVTANQAARVFVKYGDNHPEKLHLDAPDVVYDAMLEAFPCASK